MSRPKSERLFITPRLLHSGAKVRDFVFYNGGIFYVIYRRRTKSGEKIVRITNPNDGITFTIRFRRNGEMLEESKATDINHGD